MTTTHIVLNVQIAEPMHKGKNHATGLISVRQSYIQATWSAYYTVSWSLPDENTADKKQQPHAGPAATPFFVNSSQMKATNDA